MRTIKKVILWVLCIFMLLSATVSFLPIEHVWELPFYVWALHFENRMEIPKTGVFVCEELGAAISFGDVTKLSFSDDHNVLIAIDQGGNISRLTGDDPIIRGSYSAYLEDGYILIDFEELPISFDEGKCYQFVKTDY